MSKITIGIDPGLYGAVAIINDQMEVVGIFDMPTILISSGRKEIDTATLADMIYNSVQRTACKAFIERPNARSNNSAFSIGEGFGSAKGVLAGLDINFEILSETVWRGKIGFVNGKDGAEQKVIGIFSSDQDLLSNHRPQALLIAYYGTLQ